MGHSWLRCLVQNGRVLFQDWFSSLREEESYFRFSSERRTDADSLKLAVDCWLVFFEELIQEKAKSSFQSQHAPRCKCIMDSEQLPALKSADLIMKHCIRKTA